jgi:hypothetical protein
MHPLYWWPGRSCPGRNCTYTGSSLASSISSHSFHGDLGVSLAIMSMYKPQTQGLARAHPRPYEFTMDPWIGNPHLLCRWVASQAHTFTHSYTTQYFHSTPWTWETWFPPQNAVTRVFHWLLNRLSFCLLRQTWIQTQVLTSLIGGAPLIGSCISMGSIVCPRSSPRLTERTYPSSESNCPLAPCRHPAVWVTHPGDREVKKLPSPQSWQWAPKKCYGKTEQRNRTLNQGSNPLLCLLYCASTGSAVSCPNAKPQGQRSVT